MRHKYCYIWYSATSNDSLSPSLSLFLSLFSPLSLFFLSFFFSIHSRLPIQIPNDHYLKLHLLLKMKITHFYSHVIASVMRISHFWWEIFEENCWHQAQHVAFSVPLCMRADTKIAYTASKWVSYEYNAKCNESVNIK